MSVTIKDIAKIAGVSPSTVSRVVSNHPRISRETSRKVKEIMDQLGYHPNMMAKSLVSKTTQTIGIVLPRPAEELFLNFFFGELIRGIVTQATRAGYDMLMTTVTSDSNELEAISRLVMGRRVDGILLLSSRTSDPIIGFLKQQNFPFVLIGRSDEFPDVLSIDNNNIQAAYDATSHFIAQGHKRIGFISGPPNLVVSQDRLLGYKKALKEANLPFQQEWVLEGDLLQQSGYRAMSFFMSLPDRPTALVIFDDLLAFGVLRGLTELGYSVPQDICIVSFNNIPLSELASTPISSIDIGTYQLGYTASQSLLRIVHDEPLSQNHIIIPHRLIVRESSISSSKIT
ncbi:LacI family DNA-binding transcriptional regulator [Paenibacillus lignilyticus]|uniref:LacI family DNA-binding transcriptional regulator n=1 Tax=Paenibacillus lignilyticus TaxID=1172615 RepID=A0ABS5CG76_9BACL|nr:LacI family DNA-binding transcriptional regulator [Paenibacillus lignilyticus]MBP3964879.1 LacI family DNA-binding transcriptional regulator [Paenibacillus lignilyticus]